MLFSLLTSAGLAPRKSLSLGAATGLSPWSVLPGIACTCQNALPGKRPTWFQTGIPSLSELQLLEGDNKPFNNIYGATSSAHTEWSSRPPRRSIDLSEEELLFSFLAEKSRNRISDISRTSELLRKAARDSYRLDQCMYEPLNISLASSFNCIQAYQKEIKLIEQAIEKCINGMNPNAFLDPEVHSRYRTGMGLRHAVRNRRHNCVPLIRCTCKVCRFVLAEKRFRRFYFRGQSSLKSRESVSALLSGRSG